ncbi:MAG: large conductance mechanosensitive channel protein MscL, partial [Duncaniella sp.]|nr:large conductance mechanosensitive channel protein MscL [Duncaniella sp.]
DYKWVIQQAVVDGATKEVLKPEVTLTWGTWIQTVVDFLIVAFCIFVAIKAINQLKRKEKAAPEPEAAPEPTKEEVLLTEIRDILKNKESK